ncbi:MAG: NAD(P)/FAD-dependent oxidoreductase [Clostridia bacterium]|nr:NAD(P)/FAD-dependent oxidoreductase [Clostridia bacterium]
MKNIAIIGGGASGMVCAIVASQNKNNTVTIYERGKRVGKKILATGNGRCNMTNIYADISRYHGEDTSFINYATDNFWVGETLDFFSELGILYKVEDEGKVYPYSDQASAVLDVLRLKLEKNGVNIVTGFEVKDIKNQGNGFLISDYNNRCQKADCVVIATGGKAAPDLGSNGSGYNILSRLGHHISNLSPSLVQIKTAGDIPKKLKGIKVNAAVTLGENQETGEVLFTDYGLSGPPVFSLSAYLDKNSKISLDIMSEYSRTDIESLLKERISKNPEILLEDFLVGVLNKRVGQVIIKDSGIYPLSRLASTLTDKEISDLADKIKHWEFEITGTMSWNNAQVTKGGAKTREFNPQTMESRLIKGLYAVGEVLDIDGDCGGFNLQWAWSSGYLAGSDLGGMNK